MIKLKQVLRSPFSVLRSPFSVLRSPFSVLRSPFSVSSLLLVLIIPLTFAACSNGSTGDPPPDSLPSGFQSFTYAEWEAWGQDTIPNLSDDEKVELVQYMSQHLNELTPEGQQFWQEIFESISGTDKTPDEIVKDNKVAGISYTATENTGNSKHYKLSGDYGDALATLTEFFGFNPESSGWNIRNHSSLCDEVGAVIFEITDDDYRLAKIGTGGINQVVGWNRKK